ncbi:tRNA lysidine(34) synthetase TilS [Oleomonas cavernae]|uniref:tRNA(Ile)-lysidine synthase n=1 Tax=Oleomonas cavernae TaxID=2320859 RepID=A0A418VUB0_9PROT|nr:tRNA lysidine(34) synthetase TilS [Oleomonas cavernae]RJF80748.1 tRNA lysidine(34) synthetase TilS [Oleomonas cavernae]
MSDEDLHLREIFERVAETLDGFGPFEASPHLAVAVSGGADSLGLMLLCDAWAQSRGARLTVLTVDHGLRPEAAAEAGYVAQAALALGHAHVTLRVGWALGDADLEAAARAARYELLTAWCRQAGVLHLLTGHSRDDQAETVLLRLLRGSGLDGLAAMAPLRLVDGVRLLRPVLEIAREDLLRLVLDAGLAPVADPMNQDDRFQRVSTRRAMATLELTAGRLADTASRLRRDREAVAVAVRHLAVDALRLSPWGEGTIVRAALAGQPAPIVERVLARLITAVGGGQYAPRRDRLARLAEILADTGEAFPGGTLGACRFLAGRERVTVLREARWLGPDLPLGAGELGLWDGRFEVQAGPRPVTVRALGAHQAQGMPRLSPPRRAVMPAIFDAAGLIAVPALDFGDPTAANVRYRAAQVISA